MILPATVTQLPPGFPGPDERTGHRRLLDMIMDGTAPDPPVVARLAPPRPVRWGPGELVVEADLGADFTWHSGIVFGGYVASLLDMFGGLVMLTVLPDTADFLTASLDVHFDAPTRPGPARIEAAVAEVSARRAQTRAQLTQGGQVTSRAFATQAISRRRDMGSGSAQGRARTGSDLPRKDGV